MAVPPEIVEEVRARADVLDVVGDYVGLRKRGRNWVGLCPFHSEKTPSFTVSPEKGMFYCFGCAKGGNVFTFLMEMESFSFEEAVRTLAGRYGIKIPERPPSPSDKKKRREKEDIAAALEEAARFYGDKLLRSEEGAEAREYLQSRGFDINISKAFRLGWAPKGWDNILKHMEKKGFSAGLLEKAGLAVKNSAGTGHYDRFRGRIIFPIVSVQGRVLGFGGRVITDDGDGPKYLNSPETPVYRKGEVLYGLNAAKGALRERDAAIVVEGYFDCLALHKHGFTNAVATCGTALTVNHVRLLSRYTKNIYPLFDADEAGARAARRALEVIIAAPARAYKAPLPSGDPDSFLAEKGPEEMKRLLDEAPPLLQATIEDIVKSHGSTVEGRQESLMEVAGLLAQMADLQAMELYIREAAGLMMPGAGAGFEEIIRKEVAKIKKVSARRGSLAGAGEEKKEASRRPRSETYLLALCLHRPQTISLLARCPDVVEDFEDEELRNIAKKMVDSGSAAEVMDEMPSELNAAYSRLEMERNSDDGDEEDDKDEVESEFREIALRIRRKKITLMKRRLQEELGAADAQRQMELLKEKSRLLELERLLDREGVFGLGEQREEKGPVGE